jgi:predicted transcriptional regulator
MRGELQQEVMKVLWAREGPATVDEVRVSLPKAKRGAYTTVQTVLNRLADRGLLGRERRGRAILYSARISEAAYVSQSLDQLLAGASDDARKGALALLAERLEPDELAALRGRKRGR